MANNHDILNRRDRSLEQPALSRSIGKLHKYPTNVSVSNRFGLSGFYSAVPFVFRIVIILLLLVVLMRVSLGSTQMFTFKALLDGLQSAPSIDVSWLRSFTNWGDSLVNIPLIGGGLAFLSKLVSVALFGATGVIQIATYAIWVFGFIF